AHRAHQLAPLHPIAGPHLELAQVPEAGLHPVAVVDDQDVAVATLQPGEDDRAVGRRDDLLAVGCGDVETFVHHALSRIRVETLRGVRGDPAAGGPYRGCRGQAALLVEEVRLELLEALFLPGCGLAQLVQLRGEVPRGLAR